MKIKLWVFVLCACITCTCVAAENKVIPRFAAMRNNQVNMRTGPGEKYPIKWVYKEKHFPVEIMDEYELWRQVKEIDGTTGWVHRTQLSSARYALILEDTTLTHKANDTSKVVAIVGKGAIGKILKCPKNSDFCQLDFNQAKGWTRKVNFYGVYPHEEID